MSKSERVRQYEALNEKLKEQSKGKDIEVRVEVTMFFDAMLDERMGKGACLFMAQAYDTAHDRTDDRLTCFCCCEEWSKTRAPIYILTVEFIGLSEETTDAVMAGVCHECGEKGQDEVMRAIKRDFPYMTELQAEASNGPA